jgi:hypothetical protein
MEPVKKEKIFANGLFFKRKRDNAPTFIKGHISAKVADLIPFLKAHEDEKGWVNMDLKESQGGKLYIELDTFKPKNQVATTTQEDINPADIPFN